MMTANLTSEDKKISEDVSLGYGKHDLHSWTMNHIRFYLIISQHGLKVTFNAAQS